MLKPSIGPLLLVGLLLPALALAQEEKPANPQAKEGEKVEKRGVVILQDDDGEDEPRVIILGGEDLDPEDLKELMELGKLGKGGAKLRLKMGEDFDFEMDGHDLQLKKVLKKLKGMEGMLGKKGFDFKRLSEQTQRIMKRGLTDLGKNKAKIEALKAKRERAETILALGLSAEESAVVVPLLDAVLEVRRRNAAAQAKRRGELKASLSKSKVKDPVLSKKLVSEYRKAKAEDDTSLAKARTKLRELLTLRQEVTLVVRGVLD
jgi:hypothetical protein